MTVNTIQNQQVGQSQVAVKSAFIAQQEKAAVLARNLQSKDVEGYVTVDCQIQSDGDRGVKLSELHQRVDETLITTIRQQNSRVCGTDSINQHYKEIIKAFGVKGEENSFAHRGLTMAGAILSYTKHFGDAIHSQDALQGMINNTKSINQISDKIQHTRGAIRGDITHSTKIVNDVLQEIVELNKEIKLAIGESRDTFTFENQRRIALQSLSEQLGIKVNPYGTGEIEIYDDNNNILLQGQEKSTLEFSSTNSVNSLTIKTIDNRSVDISSSIYKKDQTGRLAGLSRLHDEILPGLEGQLDEYTKVMRDSFNAVHNLGVSINPPSVLTGTVGLPGISTFTSATTISGSGTVRIGSADPKTGELSGYTDIQLRDGMSVQDLIGSINGGSSGVTASITADGRFQLQSTNPNQGVVIGSVGTQIASLSTSSTYNARSGTNVSHFFGLNNLFETGDQSVGGPITGISGRLSVRQDIIESSGQKISCGTLSSNATPPTKVLEPGDVSILSKMADIYNNPSTSFSGTPISASTVTSLQSYANVIIKQHTQAVEYNSDRLKIEKFVYEGLSSQAKSKSAVDEKETLQNLMDIQSSINTLLQVMALFKKMNELVFDIVRI